MPASILTTERHCTAAAPHWAPAAVLRLALEVSCGRPEERLWWNCDSE